MGFLDRIFKRNQQPVDTEQRSIVDEGTVYGLALNFNGYSTYKTSQALNLSTVYRCVEVISNGVASLPVKLYRIDGDGYKIELNDTLSYVLSKKPNEKMNAFTFYKLIVKDILMAGNAYALIMKDKGGKVIGLQYVPAGLVSPVDRITHIDYVVTGIKGAVRQEDILHFMNYTDNGVYGISVLTYARRTLGIADYGENAAENFYKSGGCTTGFLKFDGPSSGKQREEILSAWNQATGGVRNQPNGIPVLPANVNYTQLSVDPADAQLLESRQFSVVDICRFFGVSPTKCFDLTHASYNNSEMAELAFLNDTLRPILTKIELELETKLFKPEDRLDVKFDVNELLRTDKKSQAEYFTKMFNLGVLSPNDIRKELDMEEIEGGDIHCAQVNLTSIKNLEFVNATADNRQKEPESNTENNQENNDQENQ
jgi:HK97 family phage portal protein